MPRPRHLLVGVDSGAGESDNDEQGVPLVVVAPRRGMAYGAGLSRNIRTLVGNVFVWFIVSLIVRNALVKDYREDARAYLIQAGISKEDIIAKGYIPETATEKRQSAVQQKETLQQIVTALEQEVDRLKWKVFGTNLTDEKTILALPK